MAEAQQRKSLGVSRKTEPVKPERKDDRLWGGRFENAPDARFDAFQRSFTFDRRLLPYEIAVDRAWARALQGVGIFTEMEVRQILAALDKLSERAQSDKTWLDSSTAEDVHQLSLANMHGEYATVTTAQGILIDLDR